MRLFNILLWLGCTVWPWSVGAQPPNLPHIPDRGVAFAELRTDSLGVYFLEGDSVPFSGYYKRRFDNGRLQKTVYINAGYEQKIIEFHPNGKQKLEAFYDRKAPIGQLKEWHPNGNIKRVISYEDGSESSIEDFFPTGKQESLINFKNGMKNGPSKEWFPNGKIKVEGSYRDDKRTGTWRRYGPDGKLIKERSFIL